MKFIYKYQIINHLFPYGVSDIVVSYLVSSKNDNLINFEKTLFMIDYYKLLIDSNDISGIFSDHKLVDLEKIRPHVIHYILKNKINQESRHDIIKMIKNIRRLS